MIVTIAEQFTSDLSDRERSPTIIWKPGLKIQIGLERFKLDHDTIKADF